MIKFEQINENVFWYKIHSIEGKIKKSYYRYKTSYILFIYFLEIISSFEFKCFVQNKRKMTQMKSEVVCKSKNDVNDKRPS